MDMNYRGMIGGGEEQGVGGGGRGYKGDIWKNTVKINY